MEEEADSFHMDTVSRAHPECMCICVAGALSARLLASSGARDAAPSAFQGIKLEHGLDPADLRTHAGVQASVRSLLIEQLHLSSSEQLQAYVIVERMMNACHLHVDALRPMLIAAGWLAIKVSSDEERSLEVLGEQLPVLQALELEALRLLE